jgi:CO/xanthine dehydrogenase FAD-binding subunit
MPLWKNYYLAQSIPDAIAQLDGEARLIAGGTDLLLEMQQGISPAVENLIDITGIPELTLLEIRGSELFIGAAVPLNHIVESSLVQEHALALVEACELIGGPQVRNTATLGGNVAHALPAADGTIGLLALGARAEVVGSNGTRMIEIEELFLGPRHSVLEANLEIIVGFYLPLHKRGQGSAFRRVMRPQGVALPVINHAVWLHREAELIRDIRLALGPGGPIPFRAKSTEEFLSGNEYSKSNIEKAYEIMIQEVYLRTSPFRASADYRKHLAKVLLFDVIGIAWDRAGNS